MKKTLLYVFIILFFISIYKDLTIGIDLQKENTQISNSDELDTNDYQAVKIKISSGDTVLSIVEQLNEFNSNTIDVEKILVDFKELNPNINPYKIKSGTFYYFPLYNNAT
ncbi:hypothetical protein SAMN05216389_1178 [Oceanobacillus limi]|uniref:LysM domain-containing protein n=1 Tax=Oceanobacillus limi TaxID=930131 RepID=A0A1I0FR11_9BACI|nr:hypothetical protein [Oceanobacillus limi]SET60911.1 hypothetical protein SAMN05216389_1178 [Oceanobacillus limi]